MIISVAEIKQLVEFPGWSDTKIEMKLKAVEQSIRAYTNNNFQNPNIRGVFSIVNGDLCGAIVGFAIGDTVQVSESCFNNGLYVVDTVDAENDLMGIGWLKDETHALVTKVEYPDDVIQCAVNLMEWEVNSREKVGIKSETLSRRSVTYFDQDSNNQVMGYPVSLLGCLKPYRKVRF